MIKSFEIQIDKSHNLYDWCDQICFKGKNLYNFSNYALRQKMINEHKMMSFKELYAVIRPSEPYNDFGHQSIACQVLRDVYGVWQSYMQSLKSHKKSFDSFIGKPKMPRYKHKENGRFQVCYALGGTANPINKHFKLNKRIDFLGKLKNSIRLPKFLDDKIIKEFVITPGTHNYSIVINYSCESIKIDLDKNLIASIDLGVNNLCTLTFSDGSTPIIFSGQHIKAINQYFNKKSAHLQSNLNTDKFKSKRLTRLTRKRNNKINSEFHLITRRIVQLLINKKIGTLIIGNNRGWKQNINIGKKNNQKFVYIPYDKLIKQLQFKFEEIGGVTKIDEESYTSKASFLDLDIIPIYSSKKETDYKFSGKRVSRGLYRSGNNVKFNADVNGSYNIMRKVVPDAFNKGIEGVKVHPLRLIRRNLEKVA